MNGYTKDIAKILKVDLDIALMIQDYIDRKALLDWSECSNAGLARVARQVYGWLNA